MARKPLTGKAFCITGTPAWRSRHELKREIEEAGGEVRRAVSAKVDYVVACDDPGDSIVSKAKTSGIRVLSESELDRLIAGRPLPPPVEEPSPSGSSAVSEDVERVLAGGPSAQAWGEVVSLVDACAPSALDALVDALEARVSLWSGMGSWYGEGSSIDLDAVPERWFDWLPEDELRIAPHHWVQEMAEGTYRPSHRLVRAVHLAGMQLKSAHVVSILKNPHLTHLRFLGLDDNRLTKSAFSALCSSPSTRSLEELRLTYVESPMVDALEGEHHLQALSRLTIRPTNETVTTSMGRLFELDMMRGVTALHVAHHRIPEILACVGARALPELDSIVVSVQRDDARGLLAHPVCERVDRIVIDRSVRVDMSMRPERRRRSISDQLCAMTEGSAGPRHLDVSRVTAFRADGRPCTWQNIRMIQDVLSEWDIPRRVDRITMGEWWTTELEERFFERGVRVTR